MVRSRTAAKPSAPAPENEYNLEVISIGSLYNGQWHKKYWSTSRGKDRHPYPVGYQAVRAHNGVTCKMEILEGVNGPTFLISSDDGNSASGKTPDIAWAGFQRKGFTRTTKVLRRKRHSPKMDGVELFGFKNQFILRLLRRLVADTNGIAEPSGLVADTNGIAEPSFRNEVSKTEHDDSLIPLGRSRSKESQGCIDVDLYAPDTPDEEVLKYDSNISPKNDYYNSTDKDVAKSMMSLLLPQAVPLLRNNSTDEKFTLIPSDTLPFKEEQNEVGCVSDVPSSDKNRPHDYDVCIPDSDLEDMSSPDVCVPDSDLEDMSSPDVCVPESDLDDMSPPDVCVPDSDLDDMSPPDVCVPDSLLDESQAHDSFKSVQNDLPIAQDFTGEKTQDEAGGKIGNAKTLAISSSQSPNFINTIRKRRNFVSPRTRNNVPPSKTIQAKNDKLRKPDDSAGLILEKPEVHSDVPDLQNNLAELNLSSQNPNPLSCENKCSGGKEAQFISEPMVPRNQELKDNPKDNVKFVGRYMLPMRVSSLLLKTVGDEIHICVLCGLLTDQNRTLFAYKVAIKEPNFGCPSAMVHTPIMLPDPKYNFMTETMVERTGMEFTPDGQFIVLIGSIKTPSCRESKIDCCCSTCTLICSKKNGLKIVHVESGYASVVATLEAVEDLHCISVCEPNRLVSVGGSGNIQVWVMNSTWSEKIEHFIIPSAGSTSPGIVELKRVPKCAHLVVGRNIYGEFSLWDITKLNCVSSFSASKYPINDFFPISLFHLQTKDLRLSYASKEEKAEKLLEASNFWLSKQRETYNYLPTEDVAMWFLVSTPSVIDCCQDHVSTSIHHDVHTARSWTLALLTKNSISFGSPLDPRTTAVGVCGGYGIMSTSDGVVYMWDLSRGSKLDILHHFKDDTITSIVSDDLDSNSSVVGVAGEEGHLLLYLHRDQDSTD
ncbi:uncharacterized protein LOC131616867 [Vicia villosa]|uniref:uncharacterized protein LOC131616867 n=1 Tax=Vicia villosa TaxID=3911 RepID=UPI00273A87AA|nr:uncharacterized protein LOC131616867 [Vicia villosa]